MCKSQAYNVSLTRFLRAANGRALLTYIIDEFYATQVVHQPYA